MRNLTGLLIMFLLTGCAAGNRYDYRESPLNMPMKASDQKKLVLSIDDARSYVVSGDKKPNFVGLQRGGFGNPFDVTTASGESLTKDMALAINKALTNSGYEITETLGSSDNEVLLKAASKTGASRIIAIKVNEWKSDIFMSITLHCDIELRVLDSGGKVLAQNVMKFTEAIGGAGIGQSKNASSVTNEFAKRIGYLFNKPEIRNAL